MPSFDLSVRKIIINVLAVSLLASALVGVEQAGDTPPAAANPVKEATTAQVALRLAKLQGSPVLVEDETTQVALTYANPDGSFTQEISDSPERIFVGDAWRDLDSRLKLKSGSFQPIVAGNSVQVARGAAKGSAVASVATSPRVLSSASLSMAGKRVSGKSVVGSGRVGSSPTLSLAWHKRLGVPKVSGETARFAGAHPRGDLIISASDTSFSPGLLIRKRPAVLKKLKPSASRKARAKARKLARTPMTFRMPFVSRGLKLVAAAGGTVQIRDAKNRVVGGFSTPMVTSSKINSRTGAPVASAPVGVKIRGSASKPILEWSVAGRFIRNAKVPFPLQLSADSYIAASGATFVQSGKTTSGGSMNGMNFNGDPELKAGTYDSGSHVARSYIGFNTSSLNGMSVTSAALRVWNNWSASCTAKKLTVNRVKATWSASKVTWNNKPAYDTSAAGSVTKSMGWSKSCPEGFLPNDKGIPITNLVKSWAATPSSNYGVALIASTSDSLGWKRFWSDNVSATSKRPRLLVTYFRKPNTPAKPTVTPSSSQIATTTPNLSTTVSSPDGTAAGKITATFTVKRSTGATVWTGSAPAVASGSKASLKVSSGKLVNGGQYTVTATAKISPTGGPSLVSAASAPSNAFTVDVTPPATPHVDASEYTNGGTFDPAPANNVFTFTPGSSTDVKSYEYTKDGGPKSTVAQSGGKGTLNWAPQVGHHELKVWSVDAAGNRSETPATFSFTVGSIGFTAPGVQARSTRIFPVAATMSSSANKATVSWSVDGQTFTPITDGLFIQKDGAVDHPWDGTELVNEDGSVMLPDGLIWDIDKTKETDPVADEDLIAPNVIRLRACFQQDSAPATCTSGDKDVPVQYVHHAFGGNFAEADVPGGTVALQTGELKVEETDATMPGSEDMSVGRSWMSLLGDIDDDDAIFGPGWLPAVPAPSTGAGDATITDRSSSGLLMLNYPTGDTDVFAHKTKNGTGNGTYVGSGLTAESGSSIVLDGNSLVLTDPDGTTTTWSKQNNTWVNPIIRETASQGRHRLISSATTRTAITGRFLDSGTSGWCANLPVTPTLDSLTKRGCRVMTVNIAPSDTPSPTGDDVGIFPRRASNVTMTLWDPVSEDMTTTTISSYEYNADGLLVAAWDPRLDGEYGPLKAQYDYEKVGVDHRLIQATPESAIVEGEPALTPITYGYDSIKRATLARRYDPSLDKDASTFVVYGVPLHRDNVLPDLRPDSVITWNQSIDGAPGSAVAVFSPDPHHDLPNNTDVYAPSNDDWQYAAITYMNELGAPTNVAVMGADQWLLDTTQYNDDGEVITTLDAGDRALALDDQCEAAPGVCAQETSAARAALLQSDTVYDPDEPGVVIDTFSPAVETQLANGTMATTRVHVHTDYNQGAPSGFVNDNFGTMLPTTTTTTTLIVDGTGAGTETDPRVTRTSYDNSVAGGTSGWTLRAATQTSSDTGTGQTIRQRSAYDSDGTVTKTLQPASTGSDAGTTIKVSYTAAPNTDDPQCGGMPEWEALPCLSKPAAQPSGAGLPISLVESYNLWLEPTVAKDLSAGGSTLRTSTNTYDQASRIVTSKADSTVSGDVDVPLTTTKYSPTIGSAIKVSAAGQDLLTAYDSWGRTVSTTDATGNQATTEYNIASNPSETNDGQGTFEYTYDYGDDNEERGEHRGVVTSIQTSIQEDGTDGYLHASYGIPATPTQLSYPNGVEATIDYDAVGQLQEKEYVTGDGDTIANWSQTWSAYGQVVADNADHRSQQYTYDKTSRLLANADTRSGSCQTRSYAFNPNSDRTSKTATTPTADKCNASVTTKTDNTFNAADQQTTTTLATTIDGHTDTNTGTYVYDALGRTTTLPGVDSPNTNATSFTYFADDQVASQKQGSTVMSWTRDPAARALNWSTTGGTGTKIPNGTNHYAGDSDSPAWTNTGDTITRNINGIDEGLALTSTSQGPDAGTQVQIVNPHGDITATITNTPNAGLGDITSENETDEYGNPLTTPPPTTYGWEGAAQRSRNTLPGLTLMGVRQYNPTTGRFLSLDPVEGGNDNAYTYPVDPINSKDLDGNAVWFIPIVIFAVVAAVSVSLAYGSTYSRGRYKSRYSTPNLSFSGFNRAVSGVSSSAKRLSRSMSALSLAMLKFGIAMRGKKGSNGKRPARNSGRKGHSKGKSKSTRDKHSKAQGHGGREKPNFKPQSGKRGRG